MCRNDFFKNWKEMLNWKLIFKIFWPNKTIEFSCLFLGVNLPCDKNKMSQDLKFSQAYEMEEKRWNSQMSMLSSSRPSLHSTYTIHSSYVLPILGETPDPLRRPPDYLGFALCSLFCNPVFGLFAILLSGEFLLMQNPSFKLNLRPHNTKIIF